MTYQSIMASFAQRGHAGMQMPADASELEILLASHALPGMPPLLLPGCWDVLSGAMIERAGYNACWIGRGAIARATLGVETPDLVTARMMVDVVSQVHDATRLAVVVEAGNGFGNAFNVARTVRTLEAAGAQALQLDDDIADPRTTDVKRMTVDMIGKVKAAVDAIDRLLLIARTSRLPGEPLAALLDRASAYIEAGADLIAVGGTVSGRDIARLVEWVQTRAPLVLESDRPLEETPFSGVSMVCQPMLLQRSLDTLGTSLLAPPPRAAQPLEPEALRHLAS